MESLILELAKGQGLWSVVSVFLMFYIMKENKSREDRLLNKLDEYSKNLGELTVCFKQLNTTVSDIASDVDALKCKE